MFASIAEAGYLPAAQVPTLQDMARFTNLLIHLYERVDDERVVDILRTRLGGLDAFRVSIADAVDREH